MAPYQERVVDWRYIAAMIGVVAKYGKSMQWTGSIPAMPAGRKARDEDGRERPSSRCALRAKP
jgi:hypothetical protein